MTNFECATENGRKAGKAQREHDAARVRHFMEYQSKWLRTQPESERRGLVEAFNAGYQEVATPAAAPFR